MLEIEINKSPDLLFNKLQLELGRKFLEKIELPNFLISNLNQKFLLREYQEKAFKSFIAYEEDNFDFKEYPQHLLFNMATGSGKTLIMAGCILYLYEKGYRNFLFFSTSNPIIEKTKDNFINKLSNKYLFNESININSNSIKIREVENFEESNIDDINIKFTTIHKLHSDLSIQKENSLTLDSFKNCKVVLIGDEAHHFNKKTKQKNEQLDFNFQESLKNIADDKNWESTIDKILKSNNDNILLEYTATIDWNDENIRNKYISKCLIKYDLKEFREDGYSKEIKLFQSDKGIDKENLILQSVILNQFKQDIATDSGINLKPVILFKENNTIKSSKSNDELFHKIINNLSEEDIIKIKSIVLKNDILEKDENGFFPDQNYLFMAFSYYEKNDKNFSNLIRKIKLNFAINKCLNVNDSAFNSEKQNLSSFKKEQAETSNQENILNSLENSNNEIRVIFAVNKLNEGWDVLNLYDIVRLYDTRDSKDNEAGKTTIAEAQLIGRGARYYPFSYNSDNKYKRKFDNDDKNPLKLLETLHYHSVYNSRYISELRRVLVKSGIVEATKITKPVKLKEDFRNSNLYKNGIVFVNDKKKTNYSSYKIWDDLSIVKGINFEYTIYSGRIKESLAISSNKLESEITYKKSINYKISNISKNVINSAILNIKFFNFNNLKKYIKDIDGINNFIEQYLYKLEITLKGLELDLSNITLINQYDIMFSLLLEIEKELKDKITEYQGTKEFKGKKLNEIFKDKELNLSIDKESSIDDMKDFLKNQSWFVYDSNYGTSEEQSFIKMLSKFIDELNKKYIEAKLIRNERDLSIYDFDKGRRFEPDFILILKDKNNSVMNYQVFIEPKGNHLKNNEKEAWKIKFLDDIRKMFKDDKNIIQHKSSNYKLIGLPFYNSSEENKFREVLKEELL